MRYDKKPTILLVEDNHDDIELIKQAMKGQTIPTNIVVVHDGEEALDYFFSADGGPTEKDLPDLMLLDLFLPTIPGTEVLKKLRENPLTKSIPILILSASQEINDMIQSLELGAKAFIRKQLDPEEFKLALKNLDVYWLIKE
jgi:two-component system response regulator